MPQKLAWRSQPVVDDFPRSMFLVAVALAVCVGVGLSFEGVGYGLLAAGLLFGSLVRYFVPTAYEMDAVGVTARFLGRARRVPWAEVRRVAVFRQGVHLSPFEKPSRLDPFQGTFLRFAGNADEVVLFVERQMAAHR